MWRDPRGERRDISHIYCPKCNELCENSYFETTPFSPRECDTRNNQRFFISKQNTCGFYFRMCPSCYAESSKCKKSHENELIHDCNIKKSPLDSFWIPLYALGVLLIIMVSWSFYKPVGTLENENLIMIEKLRKDYPLQKNETWYHFLGVLEKKTPSVKSITFLHGNDKRTSDCLVNELVFLYTQNRNVKNDDITFSDFEADDYGFILKHYHSIVERFGVFITDLNKVSASVARIFHSLCDEVSSDIKPSLFIFTLKYDERSELSKPVEKATSVLKKSWNSLPDSELFPLLSRVVKNVIDVVPEHQINC